MKNENREAKKDKGNKVKISSYIFTRETFGMTLLLFSGVILVTLLTHKGVFAGLGVEVCKFMYGTFGYGSFLIILSTAYLGFWLAYEKKLRINAKIACTVALSIFIFFLLFHAVSTRDYALNSFGSYVKECYNNAAEGYSGYTFGGVISAIVVYPFAKLTTFIGAYVVFGLLFVASVLLIFVVARKAVGSKRGAIVVASDAEPEEREEVAIVHEAQPVEYEQPAPAQQAQQQASRASANQPERRAEEDDDRFSQKNLGRKILFEKGEFAAESYRRNMIFSEDSYFNHPVTSEQDYLASFSSGKKTEVPENKSYSQSYQDDILNSPAQSAPSNYVYGESPVDNLGGEPSSFVYGQDSVLNRPADSSEPVERLETGYYDSIRQPEEQIIEPEYEEPETFEIHEEKPFVQETRTERTVGFGERAKPAPEEPETERYEEIIKDEPPADSGRNSLFNLFSSDNPRASENRVEPDSTRISSRAERTERAQPLFESSADDEDDDVFADDFTSPRQAAEPPAPPTRPSMPSTPAPAPLNTERREREVRRVEQPAPPEPPKQEEKPKHVWKKYVRPTLDLLDNYPENTNVNTGEIEDNKRTIVDTLVKFKIDCEIANVVIGPAITRYDVIIADKTNIKRSLNYREEIAMALMKDNVNAYLNYSKGALSIEVPNNNRSVVGLKTILTSQKFINAKANSLSFGLGKYVEGEVVCPDITKMPHLLVAGTTGSGKSICLSALLVSLLYKYGPEELRLILVDPKQVEFISYDKLPHLMINEIIYEVDKAIKALNWANKEMERRYTLFKDMTESGVATKNLDEYNAHLPEGEEKLPKIVIILDEFGDLMIQAKKDIESRIIKLVQKARACGIHLILATQRPSVDCITGLIKSNLPTRIGFKVNSFDDSRTIFDIGGAEKLLGKGDMYFRSAERPDLARIQGCFIDTHEVQNVTDFIKAHNETYFDQSVSDYINTVEEEAPASGGAAGGSADGDSGDMKIDETFIKALKYCVTSNQASVSMIQRRFPVGYIKACKIIDWMESMDYVTQSEGSKPRKVLMTKEQFVNIYGEVDD